MASSLRTLAGLIIIAAGVAAAVPFQRPSLPTSSHEPPRSEVVWRRPEAVLEIAPSELPAAGSQPVATERSPVSLDAVVVIPEVRGSRIATAPAAKPDLAPMFQGIGDDGAGDTHPSDSFAAQPAKIGVATVGVATAADFGERRHRIVDGDDLEKLARRYLGDASRWNAIYEANRGQLDGPDLLPIGGELRIPARQSQPLSHPRATLELRP